MSEIRAGGHVIGEHGWEPATEDKEPAYSMDNTKAELLAAAEGLDVDESNTKAEILEALAG